MTKSSYWQPCGYGCGKRWHALAGTTLRGHACCMISADAQDDLMDLFVRFPRLTYARLARDMGVPVQVVRAWWSARNRRQRRSRLRVVPLKK